jgi:hypothetical protein
MRLLHPSCVKRNTLDYLNSFISGEYVLFNHSMPQSESLIFSKRRPVAGPDRNIILNLNQCTRPEINDGVSDLLSRGYMVVDYSASNILACGSHRNHIHIPYQIKKRECDLLSSMMRCEKTHDFAFVGVKSPRRDWVIDALKRAGLVVLVIDGDFGPARDAQIAKCKALLNVHYDPHHMVFESLRCDRWALSGMTLLTERSVFDLYGGTDELLVLSDYLDLPDRAVDLIRNYDRDAHTRANRLDAVVESVIRERRETLSVSNNKINFWGK